MVSTPSAINNMFSLWQKSTRPLTKDCFTESLLMFEISEISSFT